MSYPILYESNETSFSAFGIGILPDTVSALVTEERNGQFYLVMKYPVDGALFKELKNDRLIKADASNNLKDQRFKIERITKPSKGIVTVYANHVSYHSEELQLKPNVGYSGNAQNALNTWRNNIVDSHPFTVYSDIQTEGSGRWTIDKVENARRALGGVQGSILDSYGGEYRFDNYHIGLYAQRGNESGALIAYGKNLIELEQEEEIASTYTSVYPYSVIYNDDGEEELITLPEYFVDSEYVGNFARRKILTVDFSDEDIKTADGLRTRVQRYIKENNVGVPRVNLRVRFIDLSKTLDYKHLKLIEEINLCDWVDIYFEKLDIVRKAKIIAATWDVLLERYHEIEVGESRASLSRNIDTTIERLLDPVSTRLNIIQTAANGKNSVFRGPTEPLARKVGDLWYKPVGDGEMEMYQWNGAIWELVVSTGMNSETNQAIEEAKGIAERARDHSNLLQLNADSILAGLGVEGIVEVNQAIVAGIQTNVKDRIDLLNADVGKLPTASFVTQEINRVEGSITTEIAKVTSNPKETIVGYNSLVQTAEGNEQLIARIKTSPGTEIVGYQRIIEQADLYERVIGSSEEGIGTNVARLVMSDVIFQTEIIDEMTNTNTQVTQLANSWALGIKSNDDLVTGINASSQGVRIFGENIVLDGNTTVDGTFTVTDTIFAENMSIDKFTTGTLNAANVNIINLDASAITAGTLSGANMFLNLNEGIFNTTSHVNNQLAGSMTINYGRLESVSNVGTGRFVTLSGDQLHFGDNDGYIELTPRYIDFNATRRTARMRFNGTNIVFDGASLGMNRNHINSVDWIRIIGQPGETIDTSIFNSPNHPGSIIADTQQITIGMGSRESISRIASFSGTIQFMRNLFMNGNNIQSVSRVALDGSNTHFLSHHAQAGGVIVDSTRFTIGIGSINTGFNDRVVVTNSQINLRAHASISGFNLLRVNRLELDGTNGHYMHLSSGSALVDSRMVTIAIGSPTSVDRVADFYGRIDFYRNLNMNGNVINNQSDARIKTNIVDHAQSSLEKINAFNFVDFTWIKNGREDFGLIAQEVRQVAPELISEDRQGILSINNTLLNMMTTHAIHELSKEHENTLLVASHAYLLSEQHEDELECLRKEVKELKNEIEQLRGMCA